MLKTARLLSSLLSPCLSRQLPRTPMIPRLQTTGVVGMVGTPLETLRELFADVWMVLVCSPVYYGMYFAVYEPLKRFLSGVLPSGHPRSFLLFHCRPLYCLFKAARPL